MALALLIDSSDFRGFPPGGQLTFSKGLVGAYGRRLALVGVVTDDAPVGRWTELALGEHRLPFFGLCRRDPAQHKKPVIPAKVRAYLALRRHMPAIRALGVRNVFMQSPECLMAGAHYPWRSMCYRCAGVNNELTFSRYHWARRFAGHFEWRLFRALKRADVILASADDDAIDAFVGRSRGLLRRDRVIKFPTRVDTALFHPKPKAAARKAVGLERHSTLIVACGQINWVKGWDLVLRALAIAREKRSEMRLVFVGDGEDRPALSRLAKELAVGEFVTITGSVTRETVAEYLNAADVVAFGSHREGWSNAMLEALACGCAIVSTDVSGARDLIVPEGNGLIVSGRQPDVFAEALLRALGFKRALKVSTEIAQRYAVSGLRGALGAVWSPLS